MQLQQELRSGSYYPSRSICFVVSDPSVREIFAADFKDRIVHHLLVRQIEEAGERHFIHDSYACRPGKGAHKAVTGLRNFTRKASDNHRRPVFYAQMDISGFFMNIDHDILYRIFTRFIKKQKKSRQWKREMLWLGKVIIFHKPTENYVTKGNPELLNSIPKRKSLFYSGPGKGLPIGNYSSQFLGNLFLNELDQFVKRELKCRYYLRYVDDFIILGRNKHELRCLSRRIDRFLRRELDLELNPIKTKIRPVEQGIDFLGYVVKEKYVLVRKRVKKKMKDKARHIAAHDPLESLDPWATARRQISTLNSYYGHLKHADAQNLKLRVFQKYLMDTRRDIRPAEDFRSLQIKKDDWNVYMGESCGLVNW